LQLAYQVLDGETLTVRGEARIGASSAPLEVSRLTSQILDTVTDSHELGMGDDGHAYFTLRKTRQR
jgi:hypothetical protein